MSLSIGLKEAGHTLEHQFFFDTLKVNPVIDLSEIKYRATQKEINLRYYPDGMVLWRQTISATFYKLLE